MKPGDVLTNGPEAWTSALGFFYSFGQTSSADLVCPFFTDTMAIDHLISQGAENIRLLVDLGNPITSASSLARYLDNPRVSISYFSDRSLHAKVYLLDGAALVGSSNLTGNGLRKNREANVVVGPKEPAFHSLREFFDELWLAATALSRDHLQVFSDWQKTLSDFEPPKVPDVIYREAPTIALGQSRSAGFRATESFRKLYLQTLLPSYSEAEKFYFQIGERHPFFRDFSRRYEFDRFLYWVPTKTTSADVIRAPVRDWGSKLNFVKNLKQEFSEVSPDQVWHDPVKHQKLNQLKFLSSRDGRDDLAAMSSTDLTQLFGSVQAFINQRGIEGGISELLRLFAKENSAKQMRSFLVELTGGDGDFADNIYSCSHSPKFKLRYFGQNSVMELFGWINSDDIPPINGRVSKALKYMGFDVPLL